MKLLVFRAQDTLKLGIVTSEGVLDVAQANAEYGHDIATTPDAFYKQGISAVKGLQELVGIANKKYYLAEADLHLAPVVPNPPKILCVGLNYRKHAKETGAQEPKAPLLFSKFNNSLAAHGEAVPVSPSWGQVDYEAELCVVMGATAKRVSEADALNYVLGYCNANDISERALQFVSSQWLLGKTPDKFLPIGPYLITTDEAGDPQDMSVKGWLNGELRQNSNTNDMIYSVAQVISYASQYFTLEAGDIISTGTPEGVILGMSEKVWMKDGDVYEVEIGNLGKLKNTIVND
jgi:2-keto-4-pentenoate hydratase/2-oxohepta-3-ene-1,7-dioic acid hydratase in catechol pathway